MVVQRPGDALRVAEELLGARPGEGEAADVVSLGLADETVEEAGETGSADDVAEGDAGDES